MNAVAISAFRYSFQLYPVTASPSWLPLRSDALRSGTNHFTAPDCMNYSSRSLAPGGQSGVLTKARAPGFMKTRMFPFCSISSFRFPSSIGSAKEDHPSSVTRLLTSDLRPLTSLRRLCLCLLLLFLSAPAARAQLSYVTNHGTITITKYTGPGGDITIPSQINGFPVTAIGSYAFYDCTSLSNITIPNTVTSIGREAFYACTSLTTVTIPESVTSIGACAFSYCYRLANATILRGVTSISDCMFFDCTSLTNVAIPESVANIGEFVFYHCIGLTNVTLPKSVSSIGRNVFGGCINLTAIEVDARCPFFTSLDGVLFNGDQTLLVQFPSGKAGSYLIPDGVTTINDFAFDFCASLSSVRIPRSVAHLGDSAFSYCSNLKTVLFEGGAPSCGAEVFTGTELATVYYQQGTTGWSETFAGRPTALWQLPYPTILTTAPDFGIQTNAFGFTISWATNASVVVEASPNLANPAWLPVSTNTISATTGWSYFSDPDWTNYPSRLYRLRWP